jgi:hypothetical protein
MNENDGKHTTTYNNSSSSREDSRTHRIDVIELNSVLDQQLDSVNNQL